MIAHAMTIIVNELNHQLTEAYGMSGEHAPAGLRMLNSGPSSPATGAESATQECLNLTLVNIQEDAALRISPVAPSHSGSAYQTPPLPLNLHVLLTATHASYTQALLMLGRAMQFFHAQALFTEVNVRRESLTQYAPAHALDRLREFKIAFDLYSPSLQETQQVWSSLGSPAVPAALYKLRLLTFATDAPDTKVLPMLERRLPSKPDQN
ncbi:DUF4255 domain-containing protein [Methylophilus luteus]|uniref:DUF4255 domain-containing protein n=1 Tax=Methylophilus luteus TaxID=640108 RepID=A0ABW3F6T4_9PROT